MSPEPSATATTAKEPAWRAALMLMGGVLVCLVLPMDFRVAFGLPEILQRNEEHFWEPHTTSDSTAAGTTTTTTGADQRPPKSGGVRASGAAAKPPKTKKEHPCCYHTDADFSQKFTREFFAERRARSEALWTGSEFDDWVDFSTNHALGKALVDTNSESCEVQWKRVVLNEVDDFYLSHNLRDLREAGGSIGFRYVPDVPSKPRVLTLGDSISQGIWMWTQAMYGSLANVHSPPNTCVGFDNYEESLGVWLGDCPWDLIQFNIGMHFYRREAGWQPYTDGLRRIVARLKEHSPNAHIVFATTTPSPLDVDPMPTLANCPNLMDFQERGAIALMNAEAKKIAAELGVRVVERYEAILPLVGLYLVECDVHFRIEGYQEMAKAEWAVFSELLGLPLAPRTAGVAIRAATSPPTRCGVPVAPWEPGFLSESFFGEQQWTTAEKDEWNTFATNTTLGRAFVQKPGASGNQTANAAPLDDNAAEPDACEVRWLRQVASQLGGGPQLKAFLADLRTQGGSLGFRYVEDDPALPRILFLGDAISQGAWSAAQAMYHPLANLHSGPSTPFTLEHYHERLESWLGTEPWDLVQFSVGMHFYPKEEDGGWEPYKEGLRRIVSGILEHSPNAHIVFATTTPSPLDADPMPTLADCPNFYTFRERGILPLANGIAQETLAGIERVSVVDRYAAIHPLAALYQIPCNTLWNPEGYQELAKHDWATISGLLGLPSTVEEAEAQQKQTA